MDDQPISRLDDPQVRARVVSLLLVTSPLAFIGGFILALAQGADTSIALLVALATFAFWLGVTLLVHLLGSKAMMRNTKLDQLINLLRLFG